MYATVAELRAEGVSASAADDTRAAALLDEATALIDRVTGWFFEPRTASFQLDGRGAPTLVLPVPPLQLSELLVNDAVWPLDAATLVVVGAPVGPGFDEPRLTLRHGRRFPKGQGNVTVSGLWGFTEQDGTANGRTPLAIRRACLMLALRNLEPLGDDASFDARSRWRIIEERTRDQAYKLNPLSASTTLTGDPDVDALLAPYVRPSPLGAA